MRKLTPAEARALLAVYAMDMTGVRTATIGNLKSLGLVAVESHEFSETYRPARHGFSSERWTRSRSTSSVTLTPAGRVMLADLDRAHVPGSKLCVAMHGGRS